MLFQVTVGNQGPMKQHSVDRRMGEEEGMFPDTPRPPHPPQSLEDVGGKPLCKPTRSLRLAQPASCRRQGTFPIPAPARHKTP